MLVFSTHLPDSLCRTQDTAALWDTLSYVRKVITEERARRCGGRRQAVQSAVGGERQISSPGFEACQVIKGLISQSVWTPSPVSCHQTASSYTPELCRCSLDPLGALSIPQASHFPAVSCVDQRKAVEWFRALGLCTFTLPFSFLCFLCSDNQGLFAFFSQRALSKKELKGKQQIYYYPVCFNIVRVTFWSQLRCFF